MADQIRTHGVSEAKLQVIHNGAYVSRETLPSKSTEIGPIRCVYAGTIGKANDLTQVVKAARYIQDAGHTNIELIIIGNGNDAGRVQEAVQAEGLKNIEFQEKLSRMEILEVLPDMDIGISSFAPFPVLEANGATKFFDYLAAGIPVLINYEGWQAEYLERYSCGLSAPQGDISQFAAQLLRLANDPQLRRKMGENARRLAEEVFDRKQLAKRMLASMETLVAKTGSK